MLAHKRIILLILFLFFIGRAISQERYKPLRINSEIKLDGKLTESEWNNVLPIRDFMQTDPLSGAAPTERTIVKMLYNNNHLYVGFHCFDSMPSQLVRFFMDRDFELGKDDGVAFQLDPYNDKNTAVVFITNTLSARFDSEISNNGNGMNDDYNNFWEVTSLVDSTGYTVEFRIPFSSLRFEQKELVVMGFRCTRLIKRKNELVTFPRCDTTLQNQWSNVSQEAELELVNLKTAKPIYFTPYIIGNFDQHHDLINNNTSYTTVNNYFTQNHYSKNESLDKILSNIGADLKYGITKNFTLNVTLNTDFAQAEVDNRIINLSKYAVNLPEKRNFFLESQNYLSYSVGQNTQLFNSRSIGLENGATVPIIGGVRFTGKQNGWTIGALNMQTAHVSSENIASQNYSAARLRKFYGDKGSFWGGIFTNRISSGNHSVSNQSFAVDAVHHFNDKWLAGFGVASSFDSINDNVMDKNRFINLFAFKNVIEGFSHGFDFELVGQKFNPAMGFLAETDYGFVSLFNGKRVRIKKSAALNFFAINTSLEYRWKPEMKITETFFANIQTEINWKKGSFLSITPFVHKEDILFGDWQLNNHIKVPGNITYIMNSAEFSFNYDLSKSYTAFINSAYGDFYGGKILTINPGVNYIINRYFRFGMNYQYNQINFPEKFSDNGDAIFRSNLMSLNLTITQSSKFSIKLLAQYDDNSDSFGGNLRLRYNPREGTDLYIVYNSAVNTNRLEAKPNLPLVDQQAIVVKYSITFGL
jgi:hypothetical protein